jgi:hypothetical protein
VRKFDTGTEALNSHFEMATTEPEMAKIIALIQEILALAQSQPELRTRATDGVRALAAEPFGAVINEAESGQLPLKDCHAFVEIQEILTRHGLKSIPCLDFRGLVEVALRRVGIRGKLTIVTKDLYWKLNEHWGAVRQKMLIGVENWSKRQVAKKEDRATPTDGA